MKKCFIILLYCLCSLTIASQEKETKTDVVLTVDLENKKVTFPVQFVSSDQLLEVFACTEQGPTHETVLLIEPIGIKLQDALKKMGLTEAIHWQYPLEDGFQMTMGDKVVMKIYFEGKAETDAIFVEDLLVYANTETPCFLRGWSFKGDQATIDGKVSPAADAEFSLINKGRNKSPYTLLLNPSNFFMIDEPEYKVATKYKHLMKKLNDSDKTKGTIILSPVTEEFLATENAKRYEDKEGLISKNIALAKKIDVLKKVFLKETRKLLLEIIEKGSVEGISELEKDILVKKHQALALTASCALHEINFLYYQMAKSEYELLLKTMPANSDETKTVKIFTYEVMSFLTQEVGFKFKAKAEEVLALEAKSANNLKKAKTHETQKTINLIFADIQPMLFRQLAVSDQIKAESIKLKEKETIESKVLVETFEKSIRKAQLENAYFKGIENFYLKKIQFLQDTVKEDSETVKTSASLKSNMAAKLALLDAVILNLAILESSHKDRIKLLCEYMEEDKRDTEHYKKKIAETEVLIKEVQQKTLEIKKLVEAKAPDTTIDELNLKYQEYLNVQ